MEIVINKITKKLKIQIPDLITRPIGKRIYKYISDKVENINQGEVVVIDLSEILVIDPSCSDEIIVKLINESRKDEKPFFVKLKNLSQMTEMNLSSVFDSYREFSNDRIVVITDDITSKNFYCIGEVSNIEHEIIKYLRINNQAKLSDIASFLNKSKQEIEEVLSKMYGLRIVRIDESTKNVYSTV